MNRFVEKPNLPEYCSFLILCERYCNICKKSLNEFGIKILTLPDNPMLSGSVSYHTDLSVFHGGDRVIYLSQAYAGTEFYKELADLGADIRFFTGKNQDRYPGEAACNICCIGDTVILNPQTADPIIQNFLEEQEKKLLPVKQGYSKCSVCVVDERSMITADAKIAEKAIKQGLDVLQIEPGNIVLEGYESGFIGGAAFKISRNVLCFTGTMELLSQTDRGNILAFLRRRDIIPAFLTDLPLFDIGGAVPLLER